MNYIMRFFLRKASFVAFISMIFLSNDGYSQALQSVGHQYGCDQNSSKPYCWYRVTKLPRVNQMMSTLETLIVGPYGITDYKNGEFIELGLNNTHVYWWFNDEEKRNKVLELCRTLDQEFQFDEDHSVLFSVYIYRTVDNFIDSFRSEVSGIYNILQRATRQLASGAIGYALGDLSLGLNGPIGVDQPSSINHSYSYGFDGDVVYERASRSREVKIGGLLQKSIFELKIEETEDFNTYRVPDFGSLNMNLNQRVMYRDNNTGTEKELSGLDISANSVQINADPNSKGMIRLRNFHVHTKSIQELEDISKKNENETLDGSLTSGIGRQSASMIVGNVISNPQLDLMNGVPYVLYSSSLVQKVQEKGNRNKINRRNLNLTKTSEMIIVITPTIIPKAESSPQEFIPDKVDSLVQLNFSNSLGGGGIKYDFELVPFAKENLKKAEKGDLLEFLKSMTPKVNLINNPNALPQFELYFNAGLLRKEFINFLVEIEVSKLTGKNDGSTKKRSKKTKNESTAFSKKLDVIEQIALWPLSIDLKGVTIEDHSNNYIEVSIRFPSKLPEEFKDELGGGCGVSFEIVYVKKSRGAPVFETNTDQYKTLPCL